MRLSKSAVEKFRACPRCFYIDKHHDYKQPAGIRAGVPMGIDRVLKGHYDACREDKTVPPELVGQIPGGLYPGDRISLKDLRNWRKGLTFVFDCYELNTAMDDLLFNPATGLYNVIDAKSKAKLTDEDDTRKYYQTQADAYDLALNANGYKTDGDCFFAYYSPLRVGSSAPSNEVDFRWNCQVIKIKADHDAIKSLLVQAGKCLEGSLPAAAEGCEYCRFFEDRRGLFEVLKVPA